MIGKLTGILDSTGENWALIDVAGVGYLVHCSTRVLASLPSPGEKVSLSIDTFVREPGVVHTWLYYLTGFSIFWGAIGYMASKEGPSASYGISFHNLIATTAFVLFCIFPSYTDLPYGWALKYVISGAPSDAGIEWNSLNQESVELYRTGQYDRAVVVPRTSVRRAPGIRRRSSRPGPAGSRAATRMS